MINVSTTYDNLIADGAKIDWQVLNGSNVWEAENLVGGSLTNTLFEKLSVGNVVSSQLNLTLRNVTVDTTAPITLKFRANFNDGQTTSEWFIKGLYIIDTVESSPYSEITKITAFDSLFRAEFVYQASGVWTPKTDYAVATEIAGSIGVPLNPDTVTLLSANPIMLDDSPNIGQDGTTRREMLSIVGALHCGNWYVNASNQLTLAVLGATPQGTAQVADALRDFDASPVEQITKVRVWADSETYYPAPQLEWVTHNDEPIEDHAGRGICFRASQFIPEWEEIEGTVLDVNVPFYASTSVADLIVDKLAGKDFYPYTTPFAFVDVKYELSDGIVLKDVTSTIANITTDITPLAPSSVSFGRTEILDNNYHYTPAFERKLNFALQKTIPTAINNQTTLIQGGFGGYIKYHNLPDGKPSEILIMDTESEETATSIIRLNRNGIGFSTDGGQTYRNAWTIDGHLNADFIDTGILNADLIKAGVISDLLNRNYWNLNTGEFVTTQGRIGSGVIDENQIIFYDATRENRITLDRSGLSVETFVSPSDWLGLLNLAAYQDSIGRVYASITSYGIGGIKFFPPSALMLDTEELVLQAYTGITVNASTSRLGDLSVYGTTNVYGDFAVGTGYSKNKRYETADYGERLLYCYETPSPLYGDVGEGVIGADGTAYVWLDPIFAETIKTSQYQVQLQAYGAGECYVSERAGAYFVVKGEPNLAFGWELKAKQGDLQDKRLDKYGMDYIPPSIDYGQMAIEHLDNIKTERQVA